MTSLLVKVSEEFNRRFGERPTIIVRAPGRVNLIGEHTDYNDGFVLPMAIDRALWIALRPRSDRLVVPYSIDFEQGVAFSLEEFTHENTGWAEYIRGTAWALAGAGYPILGWEGVMASDIPIGAGLSSSAAIELATTRAFASVSGFHWDANSMAKLSQKAENQWVGVNSGIMDQMISASGREGHALLIDCRSLETELVPLPKHTVVVVMDTGTRRGLVDSAYNERRIQCERAAQELGIPTLRDITLDDFKEKAAVLNDLTERRARHVVSENARTIAASKAAHKNDAAAFGLLMNASHVSLRDDFEVSSRELDIMVDIAQQQTGCHGARMTGAGFGGCAVALSDTNTVNEFVDVVSVKYQKSTGIQPKLYICHPDEGANQVSTDRIG